MDSASLAKKQQLFRKRLLEENVFVCGKLLTGSLTPYLMPLEKYEKLSAASELISSSLEKFLRLYVDSTEIQDLFPELEKYRELTCFRPASKHWIHYSRFDLIETDDGEFKILETNTASPSFMGATYCRRIYSEEIGLLPHFLKPGMEIVKQPMDDPECMGRSLIELSKEVLGNDSPNIAIFTSQENCVKTDGNLLEHATKRAGLNCVLTRVHALTEGVDGKIYAGEMPIDVAFHRLDRVVNPNGQVTCFDYDSAEDDAKAYLHGLRERKFVVANNFVSCLVTESKKILALLRRKEFQKFFTAEEQEAIQAMIPETYCFDKTNQETFGELVEDFIQNKSDWVIKSSLSSRGRAVWPGQSCPEDLWKELVYKLKKEPYVIQRFISGSPTLIYNNADQPELKPMNLVVSLPIIRGKAAGIVAKAAEGCVVTMTTDAVRPSAYVVKWK